MSESTPEKATEEQRPDAPWPVTSLDESMPEISFSVREGYLKFEVPGCEIHGFAEVISERKSLVVIHKNGKRLVRFTLHHDNELVSEGFTGEVVEIVSGLVWSAVRRERLGRLLNKGQS
jgi:hypothetical protein